MVCVRRACVRPLFPLVLDLSAANILPSGPRQATASHCEQARYKRLGDGVNGPIPPPPPPQRRRPSVRPFVLASFGAEAAENRDDAAPRAQNAKPIPPPPSHSPSFRVFKARLGSVRLGSAQQQAAYVTPPRANSPGARRARAGSKQKLSTATHQQTKGSSRSGWTAG